MLDFSLSDEQLALIDAARRFTREHILPVAAACDRRGEFPMELLEAAWKAGLLSPTVPVRFGGCGLGELDNALVCEELAYGCLGIEAALQCNALAATPILLAGSERLQREYLGRLAASPILAAFATSEADVGTDVAAMRCRFERVGNDYVLNGQKAWITNATLASFHVVFATSDPKKRHEGIAAFVVERGTEGLTPGKPEDKLGQRACDTATLTLEDVKVPASHLLAEEGKGFKLAMETFNQTRPAIAAASAGLMRRCLDECIAYAKERKTFGTAIASHQMVAAMLAEMSIRIEATQLLARKASWSLDRGVRDPIASSAAKAFGADAAMQTATDAVQIFGGCGYVREFPVEKLFRDAKLLQIYEGTSQIQRVLIARQLVNR